MIPISLIPPMSGLFGGPLWLASPHLEGVGEGDAGELGFQLPVICAGRFEDVREGFEEGFVAFVEVDEVEAGGAEGIEDVAEAMVPAMHGERAGGGGAVGVGAFAGLADGGLGEGIVVRDEDPAVGAIDEVDKIEGGVGFLHVEDAVGLGQGGALAGPDVEVGDPADRAATGVEDVEQFAGEGLGGILDLADDKAGVDADAGGEAAGFLDRGGEKSRPVTVAPRRAHERVSVPMWHWRWMRDLPSTGPTSSISHGPSLHSPPTNSSMR